jgi:hypothetical protein
MLKRPCDGALACELAGLAKEIMADIANYTDLTPVMQKSDVVVRHQ